MAIEGSILQPMEVQQRKPQFVPALRQGQQGTQLVPARDHVAPHDHGTAPLPKDAVNQIRQAVGVVLQ